MAKGFQKLHINSAVKQNSNINLQSDHLTTLDFGQFVPVFQMSTLVGDKIKGQISHFTRLAPMVFPTYGRCQIKFAAVYVPYYQLFHNIEGFFQNQKFYKGQPTLLPKIADASLVNLFRSSEDLTTSVSSDVYYNFVYIGEQGTPVYRRFTAKGKYFYKVLRSLGYDIPSNFDFSEEHETQYFNALPLLAFLKAYNDWFSSSVLYNNSVLTKFLGCIYEYDYNFVYNDPDRSWLNNVKPISSDGSLPWKSIYLMLDLVRVTYEKDYITSAWATPNSPAGLNNTSLSSEDFKTPYYLDEILDRSNQYVDSDNYDTFIHNDANATSLYLSKLTARGVRLLQSFDSYLRRKNYVGSRAVNRVLAQFGIQPSEQKSMYAHFFDISESQIQIGDVTQTSAGTEEQPLGSYAGKGVDSNSISIDYDSRDYGHLFVMAYVTVKPFYYRGFDREVLKTNVYDFYNPEFDGETFQAIPMCEVYNDPTQATTDDPQSVFGFTEKYNEYRMKRDNITGDFELYPDLSAWHFGRDLSAVRQYGIKAQSPNVTQYIPDDNGVYEYDRIFADKGDVSQIDHFFTYISSNVSANRPILNLSQVANLGNGDLTIDRLGEQMN